MKTISIGLILTNGEKLLLGHASGQSHWDIPKGAPEEGESRLETCIRETKEETGLDLTLYILEDLGVWSYSPRKDLYLFWCKTDLPSLLDLKCTSHYTRKGVVHPEFDRYAHVSIESLDRFTTRYMTNTLRAVFQSKTGT